tara:strand:+ start:109 stop:591 length:483 start_codon:yes stop_codon:yes gene_type:complete
MAVKYLTFNIFLSFILFFSQAYGKTIYGTARIVDGDTLYIGKNKIRLHAIDAPETKQKCIHKNKEWNCGFQSTAFLLELIGSSQIECITNGRDKYNRYIGVCYKDNIDLNGQMVLNGWAIAYRYYSLDYVKEEEEAKNKKIGIWRGYFEEPYMFRKKRKN